MIQQSKNYMYNHEYNHFNNILQYESLFFVHQKNILHILTKTNRFLLNLNTSRSVFKLVIKDQVTL